MLRLPSALLDLLMPPVHRACFTCTGHQPLQPVAYGKLRETHQCSALTFSTDHSGYAVTRYLQPLQKKACRKAKGL